MNRVMQRNKAKLKSKGVELSILRQRLRKAPIPANSVITHVRKKGTDCNDNC